MFESKYFFALNSYIKREIQVNLKIYKLNYRYVMFFKKSNHHLNIFLRFLLFY